MFDQLYERQSGGILRGIGTITAVTISAVASWQFFTTFSGGFLGNALPPEWTAVLSGLLGVVLLEGATIFWKRMQLHDADSEGQIKWAKGGYRVSMILAVAVTALYFLLTMQMLEPYIVGIKAALDLAAALLLVGVISFQAVAILEYNASATAAEESDQRAELRAKVNKARHIADKASTEADLEHTLSNIEKHLPDASKAAGVKHAGTFFRSRYRTPLPDTPAARLEGREPVPFDKNGSVK